MVRAPVSETRPNAYRVIWSSEWCELNTGCSMNGEVRASAGGSADAAAPAVSSSAVKAGGLPPLKTAHTASMSSTAVVSSHDSVRSSPRRRKLRPALWPAARASAALMPAGGVTRIVSKNLSDFEVQPSFSRPASRRVADCARWWTRRRVGELRCRVAADAELRGRSECAPNTPACSGQQSA